MSVRPVFGIDLGTTNSCIARADEHGRPIVLNNSLGKATTPSVVYFESADRVVVGEAAVERARRDPVHGIVTVKRVMGDANWRREIFGQILSPQEVAAHIVRQLVEEVQRAHQERIDRAVITCPAYFGINEREATRQAGTLAGLEVRFVIPEPTAAAFAYGATQGDEGTVLVYDLGGGTFDITVIRIEPTEVRVISTGGNHQLGGCNWDDEIAGYLARTYCAELGLSADLLTDDEAVYQQLLEAAERNKRALSESHSVTEPVRFEGEEVRVALDRETFDRLTEPYLEQTWLLMDEQLRIARSKGIEEIDKVILVGGSTLMPQVLRTLQERYPFPVERFDPHQAVAKGAALFGYRCALEDDRFVPVAVGWADSPPGPRDGAASQVVSGAGAVPGRGAGHLPGRSIRNVSSKSFGVRVMNADDREVVSTLIAVNDRLPLEKTDKFTTYREGQVEAELVCMESDVGDRMQIEPDLCAELGRTVLQFGGPLPRGVPVEVTFRLSEDGLLSVRAVEASSGAAVEARFVPEGILDANEESVARDRILRAHSS